MSPNLKQHTCLSAQNSCSWYCAAARAVPSEPLHNSHLRAPDPTESPQHIPFDMTKNDNKKDITRKNLQEHGISYDERVYHCQDEATHSNESYSLPDHVDAVREALLTFEGIVPEKGWEEYLDIEFKEYGSEDIGPAWNLQPPASAIIRQKSYERDLRNRSAKSDAAHNRLVDCERVAELARESLKKPESGWKSLWISEVFRPSSKKARSHPGYR